MAAALSLQRLVIRGESDTPPALVSGPMAERKRTKAERREAKLRRKAPQGPAAEPSEDGPAAPRDNVEERLTRLEAAIVTQSELTERLLERLDELLEEARRSESRAQEAAASRVAEGDEEELA